jgi:nucleotide-binding universal stress UspA family protein
MPRRSSKATLAQIAASMDAASANEENGDDEESSEDEDDGDGAEVTGGDERPVMDEAGDNVVARQDDLPADPGEKLTRMIAKVLKNWDTGLYYLDIYRDLPHTDSEGNRISGQIGRASKPIDIDWLRENFGGGTYRVYLRGPRQSASGWATSVIRGTVRGIVVGGAPFINNRQPSDNAPTAAETQSDRVVVQALEQMQRLQQEVIDLTTRTAEEKASAKSGDVAAAVSLMRDLNAQTNSMVQSLIERSTHKDPAEASVVSKAIEALVSRRDPDGEARMQDALRAAQQQARDEVAAVREEAARERRDLREQYEIREKGLRDEMDRRERAVRENADQRERYVRDQLEEARARASTLEAQLEILRKEAIEARLMASESSIRASLMPAAANAGGLGGIKEVASTLSQLRELAPVLGFGGGQEPEPSQIQQVMALLNTEAAKRVGDGVKGLLSGIGSRAAPAAPPTPDALAAWDQARATMNQGALPARRITRRRRGEVDTSMMPPGSPIMPSIAHTPALDDAAEVDLNTSTIVPRVEAAPAPAQAPAASGSEEAQAAKLLISVVEEAARAGTTPAAFMAQVTPMLGGPEIVAAAKTMGADAVISQVEQTAGGRLSASARQLVRDALEA